MDKISRKIIRPKEPLSLLSHMEVEGLMTSNRSLYQIFRDCSLAVLSSDLESDDTLGMLNQCNDFELNIIQESRGFKLEILNAPAIAFVDGEMIQGLQDQIFSALRDIVFCHYELADSLSDDASTEVITDAVFKILRNAEVVRANLQPNLVVCWGGHSISREEYEYSKRVGYQLGLRGLDVATGSGIGAMKGPMKGAAVGHTKQHKRDGRYIGITEPGIIASESPNAMVNELVILPDIEKRLEAFVRLAHALVVFPGGVGTVEEILYVLSVKMNPENALQQLPLIFTCSEASKSYFEQVDNFLASIFGEQVRNHYRIVVDNPKQVAELVKSGVQQVQRFRRSTHEAYGFNWQMRIDHSLQKPFIPTHENMAALELDRTMPVSELMMNLRAAFSGIVAGNVKAFGIEQVKEHGRYQIHADKDLAERLEKLLKSFIDEGRMAIVRNKYRPSFELVLQ